MRTIKVHFADFWKHFNYSDNFITAILKKKYIVEVTDRNPQYVFYSNFGNMCEHLQYRDCVKIFYTQENLVPDFNMCDYGIGFEYMEYGDRIFRYPLFYYRYQDAFNKMLQKHHIDIENMHYKDKFCGMVVSNGTNANQIREEFFCALGNIDALEEIIKRLTDINPDMQICVLTSKDGELFVRKQFPQVQVVATATFQVLSHDETLVMCSHVFDVEQPSVEGMYVDKWCNLIDTEEDYHYCSSFRVNKELFLRCRMSVLMECMNKQYGIV